VNLGTDADLAAFVARLLELAPADRAEIAAGRKRFRLAASPQPAGDASVPAAHSIPLERAGRAVEPAQAGAAAGQTGGAGVVAAGGNQGGAVRRVDRGAVTERMVRDAARAGERLVLGRAAVLTPLAADRARAAGVQIEKER
jgi:hypothetical protein